MANYLTGHLLTDVSSNHLKYQTK